jgi:hypothetical protein
MKARSCELRASRAAGGENVLRLQVAALSLKHDTHQTGKRFYLNFCSSDTKSSKMQDWYC